MFTLLILSGDVHPNPGPETQSETNSDTFIESSSFDSSVFRKSLSIVHYNVQSVLHKLDILSVELQHFDVLTFSETWLNDSVNTCDIMINSYQKPERKDRERDSHGGVLIYIKENIPYKRRLDLEINQLECIWIELFLNKKHVLIGTFYRPPNSDLLYSQSIEDSIHLAVDTNIKNIIITGDLNHNMLQELTSRKINSLCQQFSLSQVIQEPTHYTESSSSLIDLFLVTNENDVVLSGVGDPFLNQQHRYHCPIYALFNFQKPKIKTFKRMIWKYDQGDYNKLRHDISNSDFKSFEHNNINIYAQNITKHIISTCKNCIPNKTITVRPSEPLWITSEIKRNIRSRKRAYKKAKCTQLSHHWTKFRRIRNTTIELIRKAKKLHNEKLKDKLRSDSLSPKDWWKTLKHIINQNTENSIPPLKVDEQYVQNDLEKANLLNNFFQQQTLLDEGGKNPPHLESTNTDTLSNVVLTPLEVQTVLNILPLGKAAGPDGINNRILRELAFELSVPLCQLFNYSLNMCKVPDVWKQANVCAVFKKGDRSLVSNYRPISLLNTLEKVFERIIYKHVYNFFKDSNILSDLQSGFRPGDSTTNQLTYLYNCYCKALDAGKEVRVVFFDISKAFDRVWHKGLIVKLKAVGISGNLLSWFKDYLTNRCQRVILPGTIV